MKTILRQQAWELPGLFSLLAFLGVTAFLFNSIEFALIVTASLGFHELGHALVLSWYRQTYQIRFGIVGAWTASRLEERRHLSHLSNTYIHLAGPMFSLLLALVALAINAFLKPGSDHLLILANFSAQVGFLNLVPLGITTDGGKALRRLVISAADSREKLKLLLALGAVGVLAPLAYALSFFTHPGIDVSAGALGLVLIGAWLAAGLLADHWWGRTAMEGSRMMNRKQISFIVFIIWDMLAILFLVITTTPFWLAPKYMIGIMENIKVAAYWLASLL